MNKQETLKIFNDSVAGLNVGYKSLYECECPQLNRSLGFRQQFKELVLNDIKGKYPTINPLVYVSQGPGGFLWDFAIINNLIHEGYRSLTVIFIEPLYEKNMAILQAYLDLQTWCTNLVEVYPDTMHLTLHLFKSCKEYEQACIPNPALRGNVLITVDPDDTKTVPDFSTTRFRKKISKLMSATMQPHNSFYYLYFQKVGPYNYRHSILGSSIFTDQKHIITLSHAYGETITTEKHSQHVFEIPTKTNT
jgi:hypothetical protein